MCHHEIAYIIQNRIRKKKKKNTRSTTKVRGTFKTKHSTSTAVAFDYHIFKSFLKKKKILQNL